VPGCRRAKPASQRQRRKALGHAPLAERVGGGLLKPGCYRICYNGPGRKHQPVCDFVCDLAPSPT